jgi:hypothetical protein
MSAGLIDGGEVLTELPNAALIDREDSLARAPKPLHSQNLVVHRPQRHAKRSPRFDMVGNGDRPARALALAHRQVLVERRGALDRRLVHLWQSS